MIPDDLAACGRYAAHKGPPPPRRALQRILDDYRTESAAKDQNDALALVNEAHARRIAELTKLVRIRDNELARAIADRDANIKLLSEMTAPPVYATMLQLLGFGGLCFLAGMTTRQSLLPGCA